MQLEESPWRPVKYVHVYDSTPKVVYAAFAVCQAVGLECSTASSDYIQLYDGKKETLLESLDRIRRTAGEIIGGIENRAEMLEAKVA